MIGNSNLPKPVKNSRLSPRANFEGGIVFKGRYGSNLEGRVRDVSATGIYILSATKLTPGTKLLLYLQMEGDRGKQKMCFISGEVVRAGSRTEEIGFAVRFDADLSKEVKTRLNNYVNSRSGPTLKPQS